MSSFNLSNLFWKIRPHSSKDIELAKSLLSGELKWEELISLDHYKEEEPITYLYLSGSILLIGLGWAQQIPISDETERHTLTHYSLLLISSLFNNIDYQKIVASTTDEFGLTIKKEAKRKQESPIVSPFKMHISSTASLADSFFTNKPLSSPTQDYVFFGSSNCLDLFPKSVINEVVQNVEFPDAACLKDLCHEYWLNEGKQFFDINGQYLCQLASEFFISQKLPSKNHFVFDYNLNLSPWALAEDTAGKINWAICQNLRRTHQYYVNCYVLIVCYLVHNDILFCTKMSKKYSMPSKRINNILHLSKKVLKVWGKETPLARMNPELLSKVATLKLSEIEVLCFALKQLNTVRNYP